MSALALTLAVLASAPAIELEADVAYGFGARSAFGGFLGGDARFAAYEVPTVRGTLEVGLLGGYQLEPYEQTAQLVLPAVVTGDTHRFEVFATLGHTLAFTPSRRFEVGLAVFAGVTHVLMRGKVVSAEQGFTRASVADATEFTFGAMLRLAVRLTPHWAVVGRFLGPLPYAGVAISSYFMASLGVGFTL